MDRRALRERYDRATADLDPPFAIVDLAAFDANASALVARAAGKPLRVPSKSVRCRALHRPGAGPSRLARHHGVHLERGSLADRLTRPGESRSARRLPDRRARPPSPGWPPTRRSPPGDPDGRRRPPARLHRRRRTADRRAAPLRLCLDLDASWRPGRRPRPHRRPPVTRTLPAPGRCAAAAVGARPGFRLVGLMSYEAQIAGLGDAPPRSGRSAGRSFARCRPAQFPETAEPGAARRGRRGAPARRPRVRQRRRHRQRGRHREPTRW